MHWPTQAKAQFPAQEEHPVSFVQPSTQLYPQPPQVAS
jgi:hypothetical protein